MNGSQSRSYKTVVPLNMLRFFGLLPLHENVIVEEFTN